LQSKLIAAKSLNIYEIIVPYANLSEALDFPSLLTEDLTLYFVKEYKEIYDMLFTENVDRYSKIVTLKNGILINEIIPLNDNIIENK
jgi:ATP-dependent Lon protease